jgi:hypothetical protein
MILASIAWIYLSHVPLIDYSDDFNNEVHLGLHVNPPAVVPLKLEIARHNT